MINQKDKSYFILLIIFIIGFLLRFLGLNWDQDQHLHPDERFLSMVINDIKIPSTIGEYLDPKVSSLNPYNNNYSFFVYGSLPVTLTKIISQIFNLSDYDHAYLIGRYLTIILDSLVILLVYFITSKVAKQKNALIAAFLYSICVLPIQLSHFFTVDPFLNFFIILSFYFLISLKNPKKRFINTLFLSLSFGLALASKISAIYFAPVILLFFIFNFKKDLTSFFKYGFVFIFFSILVFRFFQPQVFAKASYLSWQLNPQFIENLKELKAWDKNPYYPPAIQWIKVIPIAFPLKNIFLWGLGIPAGFLFIFSIIFIKLFFKQAKDKLIFVLIWFWILFLIFFQGIQSVTTMRYFLPIYPFIAITSSFCLGLLKNKPRLFYPIITILLIYPLMFLSIFLKDHTRVEASLWIYQNIPYGSTVATEYWDDALPLSVGNNGSYSYQYQSIHIADVETDNPLKIDSIKKQLDQSDYFILTSSRFYKPIPQNFDIFPETTKFYQSLFDGTLGFKKVAEFSSYPCFPPIGKSWFCINDDSAEEAFTVYDHPKVIIFQKVSRIGQ
jgi:hypothetical protein